MRILRLATSDDNIEDVPAHLRSPRIAEAVLADALGEPVETIVRAIWPTPNLPDLVEGWIRQHRPDIVYFNVIPFWYVYESVPARVTRRFGRVGRRLGTLGSQVSRTSFASTALGRCLRNVGLRTIGGDTHFTTSRVIEVAEACIRRIVTHEDVVLVVIGSTGRRCTAYGWGGVARDRARRVVVHEAVSALCQQLHVPYYGGADLMRANRWRALVGTDRTHLGVDGQREMGLAQGAEMLAAWTAAGRAPAAADAARQGS